MKAPEITGELFRQFLDAAPDVLLEVDELGRIILANPEAARMFQRPMEELLGLPVEELIPERFRSTHLGHRGAYSKHPTRRPMGRDINLMALRKDGSEFAVDINLSPQIGRAHV